MEGQLVLQSESQTTMPTQGNPDSENKQQKENSTKAYNYAMLQ